jgi:hypothetical protein
MIGSHVEITLRDPVRLVFDEGWQCLGMQDPDFRSFREALYEPSREQHNGPYRELLTSAGAKYLGKPSRVAFSLSDWTAFGLKPIDQKCFPVKGDGWRLLRRLGAGLGFHDEDALPR